MRTIVVFFLGSCLFLSAAHAELEDQKQEQVVRVKLEVTASAPAQERLRACISDELKQYPGVELVSENEDWKLVVLAASISSAANRFANFAFSVLTLVPVPSPDTNTFIIKDHQLMTGYPNVQSGCENIVENFVRQFLGRNPKNKRGMAVHKSFTLHGTP